MNLCDEPEQVWKGVLDTVPAEFNGFLTNAAFPREYTTFCLWRLDSEKVWQTGEIEYPGNKDTADGSNWLLFLLDSNPQIYRNWAKGYYDRDFELEIIEKIYRGEPLTADIIKELNPELKLTDLKSDIEAIGYPLS